MDSPVQAQTRRAVSAAVIGNVLEWYDFSVYAFVAVIIVLALIWWFGFANNNPGNHDTNININPPNPPAASP